MTAPAPEVRPPDGRKLSRELADLARVFLKLGTIAFGGPAAHIAMMEDEVVRRRWLTSERFLDLLGATHLIPGPNSTEMAIHIGYLRAGAAGLIVAGTCFILPAALIVTAIAWAYVRYSQLPAAEALLYGIKPVVIAVIAQALWRLGKTAVKSWLLGVVAALCVGAGVLGLHELLVLFGAAMVVAASRARRSLVSLIPLPLLATVPAIPAAAPSLWMLFLIFLKIGSVLFGSGYVLLVFLREDFVERLHWLTESQLLDAVAVGQVTPGPVFTTATFIGYMLGGVWGAAAATLGIFLPAFVFVALSAPLIPRLRSSPVAAGALDGLNAASLALMATVTAQLSLAAVHDAWTAGIAIASAVLIMRFDVAVVWLVVAGGLLGLLRLV